MHRGFTGLSGGRLQYNGVRVIDRETLVSSSVSGEDQRTTDDWSGRVLVGKYQVLSPLAAGNIGCVYRAQVLSSKQTVAVKSLQTRYGRDPEILARFRREAELCKRLSHPNIVTVIESGCTEDTNQCFTIMELVDGPSLEHLLQPSMDQQRAVRIVEQLLSALAHAHANNIVHRDVKPGNIVVEHPGTARERIKLVDFGVARSLRRGDESQGGTLLGTPDYMAPELTTTAPVAASADIYSVGVLLFRLLTGCLPFTEELAMDVIIQHAHAARPDPRRIAPDRNLPEQLAQLCMRAMAIEPSERFQSAEDFRHALVELRQTGQLSAPHPSFFDTLKPDSQNLSTGASHDNFSSFLIAEAEITQMLHHGETDRALEALVAALKQAQEAIRGEQPAMGESALRTFGLLLSHVYVLQEQPGRARKVLQGLVKRLPKGAARDSLRTRLHELENNTTEETRTQSA